MNKVYGLTVIASMIAAVSLSVDASAQTSRESVKAEAAASAPAIGTNRQGDQTVTKPAMTAETRAGKKAEGSASGSMGANRVSEQSATSQSQGSKPRPSSESRAKVKADAAAATKAGTKPMGEASQKDQDKGVTKP